MARAHVHVHVAASARRRICTALASSACAHQSPRHQGRREARHEVINRDVDWEFFCADSPSLIECKPQLVLGEVTVVAVVEAHVVAHVVSLAPAPARPTHGRSSTTAHIL